MIKLVSLEEKLDEVNFRKQSIKQFVHKITTNGSYSGWQDFFSNLILRNSDYCFSNEIVEYIKSKGLIITDKAELVNRLNLLKFFPGYDCLQCIKKYSDSYKEGFRSERIESRYNIIDVGLQDKLYFGKYKGFSLNYVAHNDPSYLRWCIDNVDHFLLNRKTVSELFSIFSVNSKHKIDYLGKNFSYKNTLKKVAKVQEEILEFKSSYDVDLFQIFYDRVNLKQCSWLTKTEDNQSYRELIDECMEAEKYDDLDAEDFGLALSIITSEIKKNNDKFMTISFYNELLKYQGSKPVSADGNTIFLYDLRSKSIRWNAVQEFQTYFEDNFSKYDVYVDQFGLVFDNETGLSYVSEKELKSLQEELYSKKNPTYYNQIIDRIHWNGYCGACHENPCMCSDPY
ncbi:hypothetical protein ACFQZW_12835 [Lutibacter aestuarii]|uniref:Exodeoxyribonuclease X-like C-terminal domain-containing protein n=1 Tax=Lutibacter aestuarii TaxID=861111 RepID=A0ABW2Z9D2_9FLAO